MSYFACLATLHVSLIILVKSVLSTRRFIQADEVVFEAIATDPKR